MNNQTIMGRITALLLRDAAGEGGAGGSGAGGGADTQAGGGDTQAGGAGGDTLAGGGAGEKWFNSNEFSEEERQWLTARGLAEDDPLKAIPKMLKGHRAAEQRIGKGLDLIMDRPAKDEPYGDWARKNAAALGLPEKEEGYEVKRPDFWPKDAPWDEKLEGEARKIAFKHGLPPAAFQDLVTLQATQMKAMIDGAETGMAAARQQMMTELERDWGKETPVKITMSKQGLQFLGEKAGLSTEALQSAVSSLTDKLGDASVIRLFAAVGEQLGDDVMVRGSGGTGGFGTTPAEARAEIARLKGPDGDYAKAFAKGDTTAMNALKPTLDRLAKIASGG